MSGLQTAPIPAGASVVPGRRLPPIGVAVEQGRNRSLVPRSNVEVRRHPTSGVIAHHILRNRRDLDSIAAQDG